MFAMKSGMYYKVKKPKLIYWKSNMFRFNQTLIWTNILLCASMAQPTIPNGQKVLFRNWSMNGRPLVSFDYNCTLNTSTSDQIPTLFSLMVSNGWTHLLLLDIKHLVSRRFVWCPGRLSLKSNKSPRCLNWKNIKQSQMSWPKSKTHHCWPNSDSIGVWLEIVSNSHLFLRDTF